MQEDFSNINFPSRDFKSIAGAGSTIDLSNSRYNVLASQGAIVSEVEHFTENYDEIIIVCSKESRIIR
jgi:hypothetical protein